MKKQILNDDEYEEFKKTKAEIREEKKSKKMAVHGSGLFEIWNMKTKISKKDLKLQDEKKKGEKDDSHKKG